MGTLSPLRYASAGAAAALRVELRVKGTFYSEVLAVGAAGSTGIKGAD